MSMTKKDYELVASELFTELANIGGVKMQYNYGRADEFRAIVYRLAVAFENNNDKFDKDKFLTACGVK